MPLLPTRAHPALVDLRNWTEHQWRITDKLRPLLVNLHVVRGGQTVYTATSFLGYVRTQIGVNSLKECPEIHQTV